jgi:Holliday junction resolvasome RuvABC endonuclease subunit
MDAVLTLDLGNKTGWALILPDGTVRHGVQDFTPEGHDQPHERFLRFRAWLLDVKARLEIQRITLGEVIYEDATFIPAMSGAFALQCRGAYWGALVTWCGHHRIGYRGVSPQTIKKAIAGHGRAKKAKVTAAVRAAGFRVSDHNEADAVAIALMVRPTLRQAA